MTEKKLDLIMDVLEELSDNQKQIMAMLSKSSQETIVKELELSEPTGMIEAEVAIITEKAVGVINHDGSKICWLPKKAIKNLGRIAIDQGKMANLVIEDWFQTKIKWVENQPRD